MKKTQTIVYSMILGSLITVSSCSKDDANENTTPTAQTPTVSVNSALIDGAAVSSTETPAMSDKTAVLKTTQGTFEMEFASKPTESGTYTVKPSLTAAKGSAAVAKEVTFVYKDNQNLTYKANDGTGGTVTVTIKDGKIVIDVANVSVCNGNACKKVSVKYDFAYTPPVKPVDPIDPNPVDPNPSAEAPGTGIVDGVKTKDSKYQSTGVLSPIPVNGASVYQLSVDGGNFQFRFKEKLSKAGTYKVTLDSVLKPLADGEVVFSYTPANIMDFANYYNSGENSTGSVTVKVVGDKIIIEAVNIKAFKNNDKTISKTFSAYLSVAK